MKVKKFEAYKYGYRGRGLNSNRKEVIEEIMGFLSDGDLLGYEINGTEFSAKDEIIYIHLGDNEKEKLPEGVLEL